ncbi:hypothetical protein [Lysinibacillus fusiformis]|uniref:hypothetical protein n=1 Tax=Lysinibacillus fusiformis TaxID=28031 RepID=UPI001E65D2A9|nr:hypothetical protein [Lysinibacillus fusiformis]
MYSTGCRIGEIVKLNREDIDFQSNSVLYKGKAIKKGSLLGHEKSETTKIYAQINGKLRQDLYSKYF